MTPIALSLLLAPAADAQEIRVLHLSPDAPNVDVYVDDVAPAAITDLPFTEGTAYIGLPADTYNFKVAPAGTSTASAVIDIDLTLDPGTKYTAVAIDQVANIAPLPLVDDDSGIAAGDVRLQVVHAAAGVGDVNISVKGLGRVASDLAFGESFTADLPADAYTVGLDTDGNGWPDFGFDVPNLGSGLLVDVFAVTDAQGAPFLLAYLPDGSTARVDARPITSGVRVAHLSPDAPNVDVWLDGSLAVAGVPYEATAGFLEVSSGLHRVEVVAAGTAGPAVIDTTFFLSQDTDYTVAAFGNLANIDAGVVRRRDCPAAVGGAFCIQAFHAADGVGNVDLWDVGNGVLLASDLPYGAYDGFYHASGSWTLGLDADRDGTADFEFDIPDIGDRVNATVFAVLDSTGPYLKVLLEDDTAVRIDAN